MNYGLVYYLAFKIYFFIYFSRAGVPEKYCADIERKIHGQIHVNTETTTTQTVQ
jgi:hypothetical protein